MISRPLLTPLAKGHRLSARLDAPGFSQTLWYEVVGCPLVVDATPFVVAALPLAMAHGWQLHSDAPVSARLLNAFPTIQSILQLWINGSQRIGCNLPTHANLPRQKASGCFFSGGVDSYYTFLKHRSAIDSHVFVTGFDVPLHKTALAERVGREMRNTSAAFGVNLIEVKTNLREFCDQIVSWRYYHGAALASVAHLLTQRLGAIYVAATHTYADLFPCGSHPLLDPLWSSELVELIHDGCEASRFQKVEALAKEPIALKTLRVCYHNKASELNCGTCEKCLRTMTSLYVLGVLDRCESFGKKLDMRRLAGQRLGGNPRILMYVQENLAAVRERQDAPHVVQALKQSMRRPGLIRRINRQAKPLFRRSTYAQWFSSKRTSQP